MSGVENSTTSAALTVVENTRDSIIELISSGQFSSGDRLPPERELAETLRVSRTTLREALSQLARTGYVTRKPGRAGGTFVSRPKVERDLTSLAGLPEHLRRQGRESSARVLSSRLMTADARTSAELGLTDGNMVYEIVRLRLSDGEPISLERSRFPADRFDGLLEHSLGGSLYSILREEYGVPPHRARERIEPVVAGSLEAEILGVQAGEPLLSVERVTYDSTGTAVEVGHDLFRGDRSRVVVWVESPTDGTPEIQDTVPQEAGTPTNGKGLS